jgi:superfamily II DNA or RNA helicase
MPRIFDNINSPLLPALKDALGLAQRADFCVGYFNLRGWREIDPLVDHFQGSDTSRCRLLVGMQSLPQDELRSAFRLGAPDEGIDQAMALRLKKRMAEDFRQQLMIGSPTNDDEVGLRRLSAQLRSGKLVVKLYLRHHLHAKLYLIHRSDPINPIIGYLGSSNLTFAGLSGQGELNVDVLESDAARKLASWFDDRWSDRWCLDISAELAEIIDESWAREEILPPYYIYLKMAYHLSQEARAGLSEFTIPRDFQFRLFDFQKAAVQIAAHHLNKRNGVLIGDVVGLGKTLMASALARVFQDDYSWETLIICPKNLVTMWQDYVATYRMIAKVLSISEVTTQLAELRRYRLVLIDESHNLRNREGKRYAAIKDYIEKNDSRCILLSATPYNKTYLDLSAQLRLFVREDDDLGIRPDKLIGDLGETEFIRRHQCPVRSLAAFEKSEYADDWRELMRLFLVRRTRGFIQANYADTDPASGRQYLTMPDGTRSYFPVRLPRTVRFAVDEGNSADPYARLYSAAVVDAVNGLFLPRYGLGNYEERKPKKPPTEAEKKQLEGLNRAGKRLMGFCRTNLFKRLESGGPAFIQSVERHVLRNFVYLHAIEHDLDLPLGTQGAELLDLASDEDADAVLPGLIAEDEENVEHERLDPILRSEADFRHQAGLVYAQYAGSLRRRFKWLRPTLFAPSLQQHLLADARALLGVLATCGHWAPESDAKLNALVALLTQRHPDEKVLVFTQFADTVHYLTEQLRARGVTSFAGVTGDSPDPTALAWRFSPVSNGKRDLIPPRDELRALVATDVLSEGQNLQDCAIIVNYDLPWAIIRLIQRAGRVDRIGQRADTITCYSFLPADGVERLIRLRARVRSRLKENAEVVGTDEEFFEDEDENRLVLDLYNERAGILDAEVDSEVDLSSQAYQVWKNAIQADPSLEKKISGLPSVVYSSRAHQPAPLAPAGVLLYLRTADGNDALAWVDERGNAVTQSQLAILRAAECSRDTPGLPRQPNHHELVAKAAEQLAQEEQQVGGQLGRPSGARFRVYERLKSYAEHTKGTLWDSPELARVIEDIYRYPLRDSAVQVLNRQFRIGVSDEALATLTITLREEERLCLIHDDDEPQSREPRIICSLGLVRS